MNPFAWSPSTSSCGYVGRKVVVVVVVVGDGSIPVPECEQLLLEKKWKNFQLNSYILSR